MYCTKCGADIPDQAKFCTKCGNPAANAESDNAAQSAQPGANYNPSVGQAGIYYSSPGSQTPYNDSTGGNPQQPVPAKKPKHLKAILISIAGVIVVAGGVILTLVLMYNANAARYNKALDLMNTDPAKAKTEFVALGSFVDSSDKAELCKNMTDYSAAKDLMDAKNYKDAKTYFEALGSYEDSEAMASQCQIHIDYDKAAALKQSGSTAEALDAFKTLDSFLDSKDQAADCQNIIDYAAAKALYDKGDIVNAKTAFTALKGYGDSADMASACDYASADGALNTGNFYTAYNMFTALGSFKDSADRAKSCIQTDKTGQLYRNPSYTSTSVPLTLMTPKDGYQTCVRIYSGETLVSTLFISEGGKIKVKLPAGTYTIKSSFGKLWFGANDTFGKEGTYIDYGSAKLKKHWIYTFTLRTNGNKYGNYIDSGDF